MIVQQTGGILLPVRNLPDFLKTNFPVKDGWKAKLGTTGFTSMMDISLFPKNLACFFYPDKSSGDWFMVGDTLFVSGSLYDKKQGTVFCTVFIYRFDRDSSSYFLEEKLPTDFGIVLMEMKDVRRMGSMMKKLMMRASKIKDEDEAKKYLKREILMKGIIK